VIARGVLVENGGCPNSKILCFHSLFDRVGGRCGVQVRSGQRGILDSETPLQRLGFTLKVLLGREELLLRKRDLPEFAQVLRHVERIGRLAARGHATLEQWLRIRVFPLCAQSGHQTRERFHQTCVVGCGC
jgi:hypothetical protein